MITITMIETMWCHYNNELWKLRREGFCCGSHYDFIYGSLMYYERMLEDRVPFSEITQDLPLDNINQ